MINLLPPPEKALLKQEEITRLIIIVGVVILVCLAALTSILFSIEVYLQGQVQDQKMFLEVGQKEFKNSELQGLQDKIGGINLLFSGLDSFYRKKPYFITNILDSAVRLMPAKTYLKTISFNLSEPSQIFLSGFTAERESLLAFKKTLEAQPFFKEVDFPPSDWVKAQNIDFSATLKVEFKK